MNLALFYLSCTLYAQQQIKNLNCPEESTTDPSLEATPPGAVYKEAVGSIICFLTSFYSMNSSEKVG